MQSAARRFKVAAGRRRRSLGAQQKPPTPRGRARYFPGVQLPSFLPLKTIVISPSEDFIV